VVGPPQVREARLLAAAETLVLRYGYDKTSVAEVARAAGISKGAFYLAFASKDDLVEELVLRESQAFQVCWSVAARAHPRFGTVGAMYEAMLAAFEERPLMARIMRRDAQLLGRYLHRPGNVFERMAAGQPTRGEALAVLQEAGALRADVDPAVAAHVINIIAFGLVSLPDFVVAMGTPPPGEVFRFIGQMMDHMLTPEGGPTEAARAAMEKLMQLGEEGLAQLLDARAAERRSRP